MINKDKLSLISEYLKVKEIPILVEDLPENIFKDIGTIIKADIDLSNLNGYFNNRTFMPPSWYLNVKKRENDISNYLIIENITDISIKEQIKFMDIIKYHKIGTLDLPNNCQIIITCKKIDKNLINEEIYSLVAHIR